MTSAFTKFERDTKNSVVLGVTTFAIPAIEFLIHFLGQRKFSVNVIQTEGVVVNYNRMMERDDNTKLSLFQYTKFSVTVKKFDFIIKSQKFIYDNGKHLFTVNEPDFLSFDFASYPFSNRKTAITISTRYTMTCKLNQNELIDSDGKIKEPWNLSDKWLTCYSPHLQEMIYKDFTLTEIGTELVILRNESGLWDTEKLIQMKESFLKCNNNIRVIIKNNIWFILSAHSKDSKYVSFLPIVDAKIIRDNNFNPNDLSRFVQIAYFNKTQFSISDQNEIWVHIDDDDPNIECENHDILFTWKITEQFDTEDLENDQHSEKRSRNSDQKETEKKD